MSMRWSRRPKPIALNDGRTIKALDDERGPALPERRQTRPPWQYAAELSLTVADHNEKYSTTEARAQLTRALTIEGLL